MEENFKFLNKNFLTKNIFDENKFNQTLSSQYTIKENLKISDEHKRQSRLKNISNQTQMNLQEIFKISADLDEIDKIISDRIKSCNLMKFSKDLIFNSNRETSEFSSTIKREEENKHKYNLNQNFFDFKENLKFDNNGKNPKNQIIKPFQNNITKNVTKFEFFQKPELEKKSANVEQSQKKFYINKALKEEGEVFLRDEEKEDFFLMEENFFEIKRGQKGEENSIEEDLKVISDLFVDKKNELSVRRFNKKLQNQKAENDFNENEFKLISNEKYKFFEDFHNSDNITRKTILSKFLR